MLVILGGLYNQRIMFSTVRSYGRQTKIFVKICKDGLSGLRIFFSLIGRRSVGLF